MKNARIKHWFSSRSDVYGIIQVSQKSIFLKLPKIFEYLVVEHKICINFDFSLFNENVGR